MSTSASNRLKAFLQMLSKEPLWFKQALLMELKETTKLASENEMIASVSKEESLLMFFPEITDSGKRELDTKARKLEAGVYTVLLSATRHMNMLEVCINNNWSIADAAKYLLEAIDNDLISSIESAKIRGTALYITDNIRIGEYFLHFGIISMDKLDEALKAQNYIKEAIGEWKNLGEILIDMGCVTAEDVKSIQLLKEECQRLFSQELISSESGIAISPEAIVAATNNHNEELNGYKLKVDSLDKENARLADENKRLKDQLIKILKINK